MTSNETTTSELSGQKQKLSLILEVAWGEQGTWLARLLSTIIWVSVILRLLNNLTLFLSIIRQEALRKYKEYILMSYMAFFDLWENGWYVCWSTFNYGTRTRLDCFLTLRHALWHLFGTQASVAMLVMVSVDRLLCVAFPFWYWKQTTSLSHKLGACAFGWACIFAAYLVSPVVEKPNELIPFCYTTHTFYPASDVEDYVRRGILSISILIYILVFIVFRYHRSIRLARVADLGQGRELEAQFKRFNDIQRAMTVTLGFSALITFFLYIVPLSSWTVLRNTFPSLQQFGWLLFVPINMSSIANLFLFSHRHREVRMALLALFRCKKMPSSLKDWHTVTGYVGASHHPTHHLSLGPAQRDANPGDRNEMGRVGTGPERNFSQNHGTTLLF